MYYIDNIKKCGDSWIIGIKNDINKEKTLKVISFSKRKGKKYDVYDILYNDNGEILYNDNGKPALKYILSFGSSKYQHYFDVLGGYDELNHRDAIRLYKYYKRHGNSNDINSAKFYSNNILWPKN